MQIDMRHMLHEKRESLLSHLIIHCISHAVNKNMAKEMADNAPEDKNAPWMVNVELTIEGQEVPLDHFVEHWQSQVKRIIAEEAKELVQAKFFDVNDLLDDLERRVQEEVDKRLEDWEKEELS